MKRLFSIFLLFLAALLCTPPSRAGTPVVVDLVGDASGPTTPIVDQFTPKNGDSVIFISSGSSRDWYIESLNGATLDSIGVGVDLNGNLYNGYADPVLFSIMAETNLSGNLAVGNNSMLSISKRGANGNLNIGGNITVGGNGTGELTVEGNLNFTGGDQTVLFAPSGSGSKIMVKEALNFAHGTRVIVQGGTEGDFEVAKKTTMTNATLRLAGNAMSFHEGVVVGSGARIEALTSGSTLYLGDTGSPGVTGILTLAGGILEGSDGQLIINPKETVPDKASASIEVTGDSAVVGEVSAHDLDATVAASLRVYSAQDRATFTVKNATVKSGSSLVLGVEREPALGGNRHGIVRLTDAGLVVEQGGKIETASSQMYQDAVNVWNAGSILNYSNIIGSGKLGGGAVALTMASGSTLDLSKGGLFLDKIDANINGTIIFGGMNPGGVTQTPYALVGTNYTRNGSTYDYGSIGTITIGSGASVVLDTTFASMFQNNDDPDTATDYNTLVNVSGTYLGQTVGSLWSGNLNVDSSLLGDNNALDLGLLGRFTLAVDSTGTKLYIAKVERDFLLDGSQEGLAAMRDVVTGKYGSMLGQSDLATNIYRYASTADPDDPGGLGKLVEDTSQSGAYGITSAYFDAVLRGDLAEGDRSAVNMYTGANVGRTINAAMDTATVLHNNAMRHVNDKRKQLLDVAEYVGNDFALASRIIDADRENRIWVAPFGQMARGHERQGFEGYYYDALGISGGYDKMFGHFMAGGSASYIYGDYQDRSSLASRSRIDSYAASIYGAYLSDGGFYATGSAGYVYGEHDLKELRRNYGAGGVTNDLWNKADYGVKTWQAGLEVGYDFLLGDSLTITPSVGFNYIHSKAEDHHQTWGGSTIARYTGMTARAKLLPVRLDLDYAVFNDCETIVALTATGGYMHNFNPDKLEGAIYLNGFSNATAMSAYSRNSGRNTYTAGAGIRVNKGAMDFNFNYDYLYRANYSNHQLRAMVGYNF